MDCAIGGDGIGGQGASGLVTKDGMAIYAKEVWFLGSNLCEVGCVWGCWGGLRIITWTRGEYDDWKAAVSNIAATRDRDALLCKNVGQIYTAESEWPTGTYEALSKGVTQRTAQMFPLLKHPLTMAMMV